MAELNASVITEVERLALKGTESRTVKVGDARTLELVPSSLNLVAAETLIPKEPTASMLKLSTLSSLLLYLLSDPAAHKDHLLHVEGPDSVSLLSPLKGYHRQRELLAKAALQRQEFPFARFLAVEDFVIAVQLGFVDTPDKARVLAIAGNVRQEAVRTSVDDGVTQTVATKVGITRGQETTVPQTVSLAPYRTFSEVDQRASPFLFRMKGGSPDQLPCAALFEADGGAWRLEAMKRIAEWFGTQHHAAAELWPAGLRILY